MIKNKTTLFAICFALFIIATGCGNKSTNSNTAGNNSGVAPLSSPSITPTPDAGLKTIQVRLAVVETNADLIDSPLPNSKVIIKSGDTSLNKQTDNKGVVVFDAVPCGNDVVITAHDEENDEDTVLNHKLECKGTQADLGVLVKPFGGKFILEQRKPQYIEYDPIKNEWRSEGKVVPNEKIRGILGKYMKS